ncbi:hypothetical protein CEXT_111541 [Caerostris extrusa]|uniref:Uncharacterized protein n=1 Tax=Caerostris extrusa TaxID=172846 RepID=A0AAV4RZC9_CAEEX|nr:hypothetical protein CEXT_111541 [Caerostris extrusa]
MTAPIPSTASMRMCRLSRVCIYVSVQRPHGICEAKLMHSLHFGTGPFCILAPLCWVTCWAVIMRVVCECELLDMIVCGCMLMKSRWQLKGQLGSERFEHRWDRFVTYNSPAFIYESTKR